MKGGHAGVIQVKAEVQDPTTVQRTTEQDCVGTPTEDASSPKASDTSDKAEDKTKEEGQASTPGGDQDVIKQEAASAARPGANQADSKQAVSLASPKQVVLRPASAQAIDWRRPVSMVAHLKKGGIYPFRDHFFYFVTRFTEKPGKKCVGRFNTFDCYAYVLYLLHGMYSNFNAFMAIFVT